VTDYPKDIKAFYMRLNDDGKTVAAADCLVPGIGEIIGGSQREERLDVLERRIEELGMDGASTSYYLDLRRYGGCHHAGFGLGFERLVMYLTGVDNIRDVLPHPAHRGQRGLLMRRRRRACRAAACAPRYSTTVASWNMSGSVMTDRIVEMHTILTACS
jgi:aspartyl-tRNA synthetase